VTEQEKVIVKKMAHDFVDTELPLIIAAEEARLPAEYSGMVSMVVNGLLPAMTVALDTKIDQALAGV
jgi:hypothetical protein